MPLAREAVELLVQAARAWYFEGNQHGLRDREWMALRFLGRANKFSRTPSALAGFIGATRATASQIVKTLEGKSFLVRKPSHEDKRSVVLHVTAQGEKCLNQHDPINHVMNAVIALGTDECVRLRDSLREILNHLDAAHQRLDASVCRDSMFSRRTRPGHRQGARNGRVHVPAVSRPGLDRGDRTALHQLRAHPRPSEDRDPSRPRARRKPGLTRAPASPSSLRAERNNPESLGGGGLGCFAALAMTEQEAAASFFQLAFDSQTQFRTLAARFARALLVIRPSCPGGRREGRVPAGTCGPLREDVAQGNRTAAYRCSQSLGLPCAVVLRLMPCSPGSRVRFGLPRLHESRGHSAG
ncbi:DNA-binding MarR family transcriptional regulator [Bradyrhizobium sp. LM3.4]